MFKKRFGLIFVLFVAVELVRPLEVEIPYKGSGCDSSPPSAERRSRNAKTNDENFKDFFLKASKSVPRIGRRGSPDVPPAAQRLKFSYWADLPDLYEHNPELFSAAEMLNDEFGIMGDDPNAYDWNVPIKRALRVPSRFFPSKNKPVQLIM